ncbi:T9SS C-terminal target domain-containing protein [Sphingobacteriales bacterium UPWRP_1]|nr:hypothetical protein B6N25_13135 [Sphingobacteriales bacterium TSM_CSS]PSJ72542.1 T9SS C-terminal target domain-containing protein [Sphingobacteriales bacterium UPWRP_1]
MKTKHLFILSVVFFAVNINAQQKYFEKTYSWTDNHSAFLIFENPNGDYLISVGFFRTGNDTQSSGLLSINALGEQLYVRKYLEPDHENVVRQIIPNEQGYFLIGLSLTFPPSPQSSIYLLQVDENGNKIYSSHINPEEYRNASLSGFRTEDGGYLLGGYIIPYSTSPFYQEPFLVKLNNLGQVQWSRIYDNYIAYNWIEDMLPSEDGGAYLLLQTNYYVNGSDMVLLRIDSLGNIVWEKNYDFNPYSDIPDATDQHDSPRSIIRTLDGGFLITALIDTTVVIVPQIDLYLYSGFGAAFKTDSLGNIEWITFEHNGQNSLPNAACQLPDSSYVLCGSRYFPIVPEEPAEQKDIEMFKLDPQGNTLWTRYYGGEFNDYAYDMIPTPDDGFILCGRKEFIDYAADTGMAYVYVIKTNCMGLLTQPAAAFSYEPQDANEVQFTNLSLYAYPDSIDGGYYVWDFGDGTPPYLCGQGYEPCPSGNQITHQYAAPGIYPVTLTAIVCSDTSFVQALIDTQGAGGTVGIAPQNSPPFEVVVYPNPAQNLLTLEGWQNMATFTVYAIAGMPVLRHSPVTGSQITIGQLPAGLYIAEAQYKNGAIQCQKLLIQR